MSWAEVKKINSNIKKPLDKMNYELFYNLALIQNGGYGTSTSEVFILPEGKNAVGDAEYVSGQMRIIVLPQTIRSIGTRAFDQCTNLERIVIPEGVETISGFAFRACTNLKSIRLPSTITTLNSLAFQGDNLLEDIFVTWSEGEIEGAPWGATNATIHYNA